MRISDWSSDVCSSDLAERHHRLDAGHTRQALMDLDQRIPPDEVARKPQLMDDLLQPKLLGLVDDDEQHLVVQLRDQIGRASCREGECQYVSISVVAVP